MAAHSIHRGSNMGTWRHSGEVLRRAGGINPNSLGNRVRRWFIQLTLPPRDSDLPPEEWTVLEERWTAAGGTSEELSNLIERDVLDI